VKIIKFLWATVLCVSLLLAVPAKGQGQLEYTVNADNTLTITGYAGPPWAVTIPTSINGLTVTSIGVDAFENASSLTSAMIPNGVTSIGDSAFYYCTSLTNVALGNSVKSIGSSAFANTGLTGVTFPGSVTSIEGSAF
jgi:hypothetical protein